MFRRRSRRNPPVQTGGGENIQPQRVEEITPTNLPGWLIHHTIQSKLSLVEVGRLWNRFQQLGVDDRGNVLSHILEEHPFVADSFLRQVWKTIPREEDESVSFASFLGVMKWWQDLDKEGKIKAIYKMLNKDQPLDQTSLEQILMALNSDLEEEEARSTAELLLNHLDNKNQGFIDEEQWTEWVMGMPSELLDDLVSFHIIPTDLSPPGSQADNTRGSPVTEEQLILVASCIGEKNWTNLAENLGLTNEEIFGIQDKFQGRSREQAYQMLILWKRKERKKATVEDLAMALSDSDFGEIKEDLMEAAPSES